MYLIDFGNLIRKFENDSNNLLNVFYISSFVKYQSILKFVLLFSNEIFARKT